MNELIRASFVKVESPSSMSPRSPTSPGNHKPAHKMLDVQAETSSKDLQYTSLIGKQWVDKNGDEWMIDSNGIPTKHVQCHEIPSDEQSEETSDKAVWKWTFESKNNALYSLSPFISKYLYSKYMVIPWVLLALVANFMQEWTFIRPSNELFGALYVGIALLYPVPWIVAALLSVNKEIIPRIMVTADSWIISGTGLMLLTFISINSVLSVQDNEFDISISVLVMTLSMEFIFLELFLILVCSIDGIQEWTQNSRIFFLGFVALLFLYNSFNWEYLVEDRIVDIPMMGKYGSFSITSKISNAFWVLFLFCAKMAFNAWFKGKDRCIGIKYSPFIEWKDSGYVAEREIASSMENGDKNGHV